MKKTWVRKTLSVGVLAAGALLLAPAANALADTDQVTTGNVGALNGTQVAIPVTVPMNVVGNSTGVLGAAQSFGAATNQVESGRSGGGTRQASARNHGALNGTQVAVPITVPVNMSGNAAAVAGQASATGVSANRVESARAIESAFGGFGGSTDQVSFGNYGTLNGTQVAMPVTIPVNACGNSLALIGSAGSTGVCSNQVGGGGGGGYVGGLARTAGNLMESKSVNRTGGKSRGAAKRTESCVSFDPCGSQGSWLWPTSVRHASYSSFGGYSGAQYAAPITMPVNACGNSLAMLGYASAYGSCSNDVGSFAYAEPVQFAYVEPIRRAPRVRWVKQAPVYQVRQQVRQYVVRESPCDVVYVRANDCDGDDGGYVGGDNDGYGYNDGDVRGDNGYNDDDVAPDNDGYSNGGNRGNEAPTAVIDAGEGPDDAGYVKTDRYGNKVGGRPTKESGMSGLTRHVGGLGGLGGLDLLSTLR